MMSVDYMLDCTSVWIQYLYKHDLLQNTSSNLLLSRNFFVREFLKSNLPIARYVQISFKKLLKYSMLLWIDVFCLPVGLYSILKPFSVVQDAVLKWTIISLLEDMWLGGIESPQYFPIMGDVLEPPS